MLEGSLKAGSAVGVRGERVGRTEDVLAEDRKGPVEERGDGKGGGRSAEHRPEDGQELSVTNRLQI